MKIASTLFQPVRRLAVGLLVISNVKAQQSSPARWPSFSDQGIIIDKETATWNPTNEFIFPSIFHAGQHLTDPLGEWYLYYSLRTNAQVASSTPATPIVRNDWVPHYNVSHVSSPDAIWNSEAGAVFLYFHGENSHARLASSPDALAFEYGGKAVDNAMGGANVTETSYARVFPHPERG
ncbi:uncharacterized protein PgNI_11530 [Pyricularia grisea]|uniref:Uncharacterized protein n=1 Tax=Pyricularia grisea TaxID=148305 RepID=A0A6P8ANG7_PYRGI|nr:uncharacterized protein PgNI_11530 [Pyricularia grisea]TLD03566.1 hypothetical protein PgNI_11530 [Pyricularia grisea]